MSLVRLQIGRAPPGLPDAATVLAGLPVPVLVVDAKQRIRFANPAAEQFLGLSMQQLAQHALPEIVGADSPLSVLIEQVRRSEATIADHDLTLAGPRLARRGVSVSAAPMPDEEGSVLLAIQDVSAARALDRQLNFRAAARSVTGLAATLAHEVRNPLSGIRGAAQLLEASVAEADRELAVLIRDEADRIRALVDRMESFGGQPVQRGPVNIHRVLDHVRRLAGSGFAAHLRIAAAYDPSLPPVWGNRDQLVQVMLNLVKNAAEAITGAGAGEITLLTAYQHGVRVAVPGARRRVEVPLLITVRDSGPGITPELQTQLFEPFVTGKPGGQGLGLALVAKIVGDHGGLIEVESRPGRTEFRVALPVAPGDENAGDESG